MSYKLKNVNGKVTFLLRTGKDMVQNQSRLLRTVHYRQWENHEIRCERLSHQHRQQMVFRGRSFQENSS